MATVASGRCGRPTAEVSRHKERALLAAAREEFSRRGYRAVTMRGVADRAQVSTRTLYNYHKDKLGLFAACLDVGAEAFPRIADDDPDPPARVLARYAAGLVEALTVDSSLRLGMMVYHEGGAFPELAAAAEANQERFLVAPLAAYLHRNALGGDDPHEAARMFNVLATSHWQRAALYRRAMPTPAGIAHHAERVTRLFLHGATPARPDGDNTT